MSDYNFNYDGSKFRLQIDNIQYFTNEKKKTVTVVADVRVHVPAFVTRTIDVAQLPNGFISEWYPYEFITMTATARCLPGDVFDEHLGQKIAMAKLEAKAYARFKKTLDRWISRFNNFIDSLGKMYEDFSSKAANACQHDLRYIQDISTTATEKSGLQ